MPHYDIVLFNIMADRSLKRTEDHSGVDVPTIEMAEKMLIRQLDAHPTAKIGRLIDDKGNIVQERQKSDAARS